MPKKTWDTAADWEAEYRIDGVAGYGQAMIDSPDFDERADALIALGVTLATDRILVVGSGPSAPLVMRLKDRGVVNAWGLDPSAHVQSRSGEWRGDVLVVDSDINGGGQLRQALRNGTGDDEFDWIVTEQLLESLEESPQDEIAVVLNVIEGGLFNALGNERCVHFVKVGWKDPVGSGYTVKTPAEWVAKAPDHTWMSVHGVQF